MSMVLSELPGGVNLQGMGFQPNAEVDAALARGQGHYFWETIDWSSTLAAGGNSQQSVTLDPAFDYWIWTRPAFSAYTAAAAAGYTQYHPLGRYPGPGIVDDTNEFPTLNHVRLEITTGSRVWQRSPMRATLCTSDGVSPTYLPRPMRLFGGEQIMARMYNDSTLGLLAQMLFEGIRIRR